MGLLDFFFKKTLRDIEEKISHSFNNIRGDMNSVAEWIHHFKERHESTESEISNIKAELDALKGQLRTFQGQVRTSQRTTQDISKDISLVKKDVKKFKKPEIFDKSLLAKSHVELLSLLYHTDRPLSYEEISKRLSKTIKSIRNLIYEMRKKGLEISDRPIGLRQKGFYITKEAKIKVSGR